MRDIYFACGATIGAGIVGCSTYGSDWAVLIVLGVIAYVTTRLVEAGVA